MPKFRPKIKFKFSFEIHPNSNNFVLGPDKIHSYDTEFTRRLQREGSPEYDRRPHSKMDFCPPANGINRYADQMVGNFMPHELESPTQNAVAPAQGNQSFRNIQQGPGVLRVNSPDQRPRTSPALPRVPGSLASTSRYSTPANNGSRLRSPNLIANITAQAPGMNGRPGTAGNATNFRLPAAMNNRRN